MRSINILVDEGFNKQYLDLLNLGFKVENVFTLADLKNDKISSRRQVDLLVFTGGEDVHPSLYNESVGQHTYCNTSRDDAERTIFNNFSGIPKLGICRGSQFLTVISGGKLIQHVEGHSGNHTIEVKSNNGNPFTYEITSTHHQMLYPYNLRSTHYELIAWSKVFKSNVYLNGNNEQMELPASFLEPEIVKYPRTRSLAIQGHPEFSTCPVETKELVITLIKELLDGK